MKLVEIAKNISVNPEKVIAVKKYEGYSVDVIIYLQGAEGNISMQEKSSLSYEDTIKVLEREE